jgi:hypothetical protein
MHAHDQNMLNLDLHLQLRKLAKQRGHVGLNLLHCVDEILSIAKGMEYGKIQKLELKTLANF